MSEELTMIIKLMETFSSETKYAFMALLVSKYWLDFLLHLSMIALGFYIAYKITTEIRGSQEDNYFARSVCKMIDEDWNSRTTGTFIAKVAKELGKERK